MQTLSKIFNETYFFWVDCSIMNLICQQNKVFQGVLSKLLFWLQELKAFLYLKKKKFMRAFNWNNRKK